MAIVMRRIALAAGSLTFAILIAGCDNSGDYSRATKPPGIKGQFLVSRTGTGIALTDDVSSVDYQFGSEKETLFTGEGGSDPVVMIDKPNGLVVIASCGNHRVTNVASAFNETLSRNDGKRFRVQLINNPGFSYHGRPICMPAPSQG